MKGEVERRLREKLGDEEYKMALELLGLKPTKVREYIEEKAEEALRALEERAS